jgi:hypothetical protein
MARELCRTTLIREVAWHLGSPAAGVSWLRSLPQSDDDGTESVRAVACDVLQRTRLFPDDPNCFERAFAALVLLEVLEPRTERMLVTVEHPMRHTGVVERRGGRWVALDLFPRRNFSWPEFGKDVLQGVHGYVAKPVMKFYLGEGGGQAADWLGNHENKWIGREKKSPDQKKNETAQRPTPAGAATARADQPKGGANGETKQAASTAARTEAVAAVLGSAGGSSAASSSGQAKRWGLR